MAFQGFGLGADRTLIATLTRLLPVRLDTTLIMQVSPTVAVERMAARRQVLDRYEAMDAGFHARATAGFLAIAAAELNRCVIMDADDSVDEGEAAVWAVVSARLH